MSVKPKKTAEFKPGLLEKFSESLFPAALDRRRTAALKPATSLRIDVARTTNECGEIAATAPKKIAASNDLAVDSATQTVRNQYESMPYPFRNPEDDKTQILTTYMDDLPYVNYRCYRGRRNFDKSFRVLVAGGGTGDAFVYLAAQIHRLPKAHIAYVDLSAESMKIAKARLHNQSIRMNAPRMKAICSYHHASLLDVGSLDIGTFDYINCSGVLHHLADPLEGLRALKNVLNPGGAMGIMVYGQIGRTSIYAVQDMMRIVNRGVEDPERKIRNTRLLLKNLPSINTHRISNRWVDVPNSVELYDLFLHSRDRAYTIPQLYEWIESAGLYFNDFSPTQKPFVDHRTAPVRLSRKLNERLSKMSDRDAAAAYELIFGCTNKFEFHLSDSPDADMDIHDEEAIPFFGTFAVRFALRDRLVQLTPQEAGKRIAVDIEGPVHRVSTRLETTSLAISAYHLIDGRRTMREILAKLRLQYPGVNLETLRADLFKDLKPAIDSYTIHFMHPSGNPDNLVRV
ncbi:MAG TPA: hypothetical protein DEB39_15730 [Planctomycetaceae bacterium]|nr:hypothetical protein [Planctomycetaceae bacterium]